MIGAGPDYYSKRAVEARSRAAKACCEAVREKCAELARIYEFNARRALARAQ